MFRTCYNLETIRGNIILNKATTTDYLFYNCYKLNATIQVRNQITSYNSMFFNTSTTSGQVNVEYISSLSSFVDTLLLNSGANTNVIKESNPVE